MNAKDQLKVLSTGFTIIRERDLRSPCILNISLYIYAKTTTQSEWHCLEGPFPTIAARMRRMKVLLENPKIIED